MASITPQTAAARQGACSTSGRLAHGPAVVSTGRNVSLCPRYQKGLHLCRVTNVGKEMADEELDKFNEEYMNLGPQWQIPDPEKGPLERRVQTTFVEGLLSGDVSPEETQYWFTEPKEGWNQEDKVVRKARECAPTFAFAHHEGIGRRPLSDYIVGMELSGTVCAVYFNHGVKVDLGGQYDGLLPVANAEEAWVALRGHFKLGSPVKVRVYRIFHGPRCRFPIQLELLEPAELVDKMMPSDEYFPAFDFRGLSTVEELEWATGGMDVTGGKHVEINIFSRERLEERKAQVASVSAVEEWPERLQMGMPPPPLPQYMPPSAIDDAAASLFF
ncbi:hypothetical protein COCOBI_02-6340 [Coccomyxa sp. Obi]|nr:hypothetical protein COCOBI_02-6340 [Coccomyxa sp. Obi]